MSDKENQLEQEWRALVLNKLTSLEIAQNDMRDDLAELKQSCVKPSELSDLRNQQKLEIDALRTKIELLELGKAKFIGISIGVSSVVTLLGWIIGLVVLWLSGHSL